MKVPTVVLVCDGPSGLHPHGPVSRQGKPDQGVVELREQLATVGWSHPRDDIDLCPACTSTAAAHPGERLP